MDGTKSSTGWEDYVGLPGMLRITKTSFTKKISKRVREEVVQQQKEEAQGRNLKILHSEDEGGAHKGI